MDDKDQVKQKIDIVDLINEYVPLKKTGRNFKANCPFHNEKSPSFVVSPDRQIWHCFGCGKGSDIFGFLMEYDNIGFGEALKYLADRAGVKLTQPAFKDEIEKKKDMIYSLNSLAAHFYEYLLFEHPIGKPALTYLTQTRKLPEALIKKFNIGFSPARGNLLTQYLTRKKGYKPSDLVDAGLAGSKEGRVFDFFRNRVMFPLYDTRGNIIAFSGRVLDPPAGGQTLPKYVNNRETPVYRKGDTLFGLYFAKDEIKKEEKVILVEGEFDVISAFHEGIKNIVAIKGTALTENQIKTLKRYAQKIIFCFDTDPAGTAAQRRSIELIEKEGVAASVVIPPHGKDPDELLREDPVAFKTALKHDTNIYDFIITSAVEGKNTKAIEDKRLILQKTLPILMQIDNEVIKEHFLKKLADTLDTSLESILKQGEKIKTPLQIIVPAQTQTKRTREELTEEYLLSLLLQSPNPKQYCSLVENIVTHVSLYTPAYNRLFKLLKDFCTSDEEFTIHDFVMTLPPELLELFDRCYLAPISPFKDSKHYQEEVEKTAREVKLLSTKNKLREITSQIKANEENATEEEFQQLRNEFKELTDLLK